MRYRWGRGERYVERPEGSAGATQPAYGTEARRELREEHAGESSKYIGPLVYGGLDGIVTTFAIVSGVAGAALGANVVLILGLANLLADGVSMAAGAYLSTRSEDEYYERERQLEQSQVERAPAAEQGELESILRSKGYQTGEAREVVDIEGRDRERLVDTMMVHELGMVREERSPLLIGLATLVAFVVAGAIPLAVYLAGLFVAIPSTLEFPLAGVLTAAALFGVGAARVFVTERSWVRSGVEMLVVGGLAATVAYVVGTLLRDLGA